MVNIIPNVIAYCKTLLNAATQPALISCHSTGDALLNPRQIAGQTLIVADVVPPVKSKARTLRASGHGRQRPVCRPFYPYTGHIREFLTRGFFQTLTQENGERYTE